MFIMYPLSPITCVLINVALYIYEDGTTYCDHSDQGKGFKNQLNDEWKNLKLLSAVIVEHEIILTNVYQYLQIPNNHIQSGLV